MVSGNIAVLNTTTTKEIIVYFRRSRKTTCSPLHIDGEEVEIVENNEYMGVHTTSDLTWFLNIQHQVKKAETVLPEEVEAGPTAHQAPGQRLQEHNRAHPLPVCHRVV